MKNIVTTIPRSKFKNWEECLQVLNMCDGETVRFKHRPWFWTINTMNLPKDIVVGESLCFMVYDGFVRGYFYIQDTDISENWRNRHNIGKPRNTKIIVMAVFKQCRNVPMTGFQGWRYAELIP